MPKPNYAFEKRQRELAKKKKQDEKDARKREAREAAAALESMPTPASPEPQESRELPAVAEPPAVPGPRIHRRQSS